MLHERRLSPPSPPVPPGSGPGGRLHLFEGGDIGTYAPGVALTLSIEIGRERRTCRISKDGRFLREVTLDVRRFDSIRIILSGPLGTTGAFDDFRVLAEGVVSER